MVTLQTITLWSETVQAIVDWTVALETETDEGGNKHQVIIARYNDEIYRFSPNTTDVELQEQVNQINGGHL